LIPLCAIEAVPSATLDTLLLPLDPASDHPDKGYPSDQEQ
jgi:hypothetical protein